jgi:hypothetical protein
MSRVKDLVQLKLQQRLIAEKVGAADSKIERLNEILHKKNAQMKATGKFIEPAEETILTKTGHTVADFRMPIRSNKITLDPLSKRAHAVDRKPAPITNENIIRIRHDNVRNTICKREIRERVRQKEARMAEKQKKEAPRKFPVIDVPRSFLPDRYVRGELPCSIEHGVNGLHLSWACPLENLDYDYYLPVFFDGLQCKEHPSGFIAQQGIEDLLIGARGHPEWVIPVIPKLVRLMRNALAKYDTAILLSVLKVVRQLVKCNDGVGEALLKHSKHFLSPLGVYMDKSKNTGDAIDYGQRKQADIGEEV